MPIEYHELKPKESKIVLSNREYDLRPFDLAAQSWTYHRFANSSNANGVEVLAERIQDLNDFEAPMEVVFHLIKDKSSFTSYSDFKNKIENEKNKYLKIMELRQAIVDCLGVSQPRPEELRGEIELKKSLTAAGLRVQRPVSPRFMIYSLLVMVIAWILFMLLR